MHQNIENLKVKKHLLALCGREYILPRMSLLGTSVFRDEIRHFYYLITSFIIFVYVRQKSKKIFLVIIVVKFGSEILPSYYSGSVFSFQTLY